MNRTNVLLFALAFAFTNSARTCRADDQTSNPSPTNDAPRVYPWSESEDFVRVPKTFLSEITLWPVTMTDDETRLFVLKDEFVKVFKLTPSEVASVNSSLAQALHEYRITEGKHLIPTNSVADVAPPRRRGPAAIEKFSFVLVPFPEEARAIRRKLEDNVRKALGDERSRFFWQVPGLIDGEMSTFQEPPPPVGMVRTTTITFQLTDAPPRPLVDLYRSSMSRRLDGRPGGGGGTSGYTYGAPLDQYAPETMKPVLARWRKTIAEGTVTSAASNAIEAQHASPIEKGTQPGPPAESRAGSKSQTEPTAPGSNASWDEKSPYVDLPKTVVRSLQIPGLSMEGRLSEEATTVFGLTSAESQAVAALYDQMKSRFEKIERANFVRSDADANSFVLHAFPEKATALQQEWTEKLKGLVGNERGELLNHSIQTPMTPMQLRKPGRPPSRDAFMAMRERGPDWLHRGMTELHIEISSGPAARDGTPTLRIEYRAAGEGGERGSWSGSRERIPERWRHLLTPDVLGVPLTL